MHGARDGEAICLRSGTGMMSGTHGIEASQDHDDKEKREERREEREERRENR